MITMSSCGAAGPRIALYSHDTLGFGHLRRNIMLANQLCALPSKPSILLIAGMREAGAFDLPEGIDLITLPAYAKGSDGRYAPRHLDMSLSALTHIRALTIRAAIEAYRPDLFIVDNVPRGAQNELDPTLKMLREGGETHVVLGLRDVIDRREKVRPQWVRQQNFSAVTEWFDEVWIYGDARFYDLIHEYGMGPLFAQKARFTGYLQRDHAVNPHSAHQIRDQVLNGDTRPYVLAMVGGGRDGLDLCKAMAASKLPEGRHGILVTGSQMSPKDARVVADLARDNPDLTVIEFLSETIALIEGAEKVIGMGGYNSVCEMLALSKDALVVPRVKPRAEQFLRAERLEAAGLIDMMLPSEVSAEALTQWMARPPRKPVSRYALDMRGLERVAEFATQALNISSPIRLAI